MAEMMPSHQMHYETTCLLRALVTNLREFTFPERRRSKVTCQLVQGLLCKFLTQPTVPELLRNTPSRIEVADQEPQRLVDPLIDDGAVDASDGRGGVRHHRHVQLGPHQMQRPHDRYQCT